MQGYNYRRQTDEQVFRQVPRQEVTVICEDCERPFRAILPTGQTCRECRTIWWSHWEAISQRINSSSQKQSAFREFLVEFKKHRLENLEKDE